LEPLQIVVNNGLWLAKLAVQGVQCLLIKRSIAIVVLDGVTSAASNQPLEISHLLIRAEGLVADEEREFPVTVGPKQWITVESVKVNLG